MTRTALSTEGAAAWGAAACGSDTGLNFGSIVNFHVTPTTKLEFLLGKQLPYVAVGLANFVALLALCVWLFHVPVKGSLLALTLGSTYTTGILLVAEHVPVDRRGRAMGAYLAGHSLGLALALMYRQRST